MTGDGVEVPEKIKLGPGEQPPRNLPNECADAPAPESTDFWFAK